MGYTGDYDCPVAGCTFTTPVIADRYGPRVPNRKPELIRGTATKARVTMLSHGYEVHTQEWNTVGNETFLPIAAEVPEAPPTPVE